MPGIRIDGVSKLFGDVRAVDDISLDIAEGELFFLLGPSGCGKTTLLRLLAGFYYPDGGRIFFGDRDITDVPPHQRRTGMVFQNYALWPHMTVRENLAFGLEMHNVATQERRARVAKALDMVQMTEYGDRSPNQLSGGQQQRVALGRALVLEPDVVLMDEPLSNLDAKLRLEMREQIKRIHERLGLTMVYVTHDQSEALSMASRIAVMLDGRIVQIGAPREIYNRPASRFVADFIGETNLIQGKVAEVGGRIVVETASGRLQSTVAPEGLTVGDSVWCSIRPERLSVLDEGAASGNALAGDVVRAVYLGSHEQYFVKLADGTELKAVEYDARTAKASAGQTVRLGCAPEDIVLLKAN